MVVRRLAASAKDEPHVEVALRPRLAARERAEEVNGGEVGMATKDGARLEGEIVQVEPCLELPLGVHLTRLRHGRRISRFRGRSPCVIGVGAQSA